GVSGTIDYDVTPDVHFKSVTAYRKWWNQFGRGDASPLGNSETFDDTRHNQLTEEATLTGTLFSRLDYAAGAFYYHAFDKNTGYDSLWPTPPGLPPLPAGAFQNPILAGAGLGFLNGNGLYDHDLDDHQITSDYAFFVHGVLHVTDKLNVIAGV